MGFNCGIVGLPNVGKSTLFNALTRTAAAQAANFPFCTIEPNIGRVAVPDPRLARIGELAGSARVLPTQLEFVDIAGLVAGASKGEGLGNQFLANIREVDAILYVLRCFADPDVSHVAGALDPLADAEVIETELMLADMEQIARRLDTVQRKARSGEKEARAEQTALEAVQATLAEGRPARLADLRPEDAARLRHLNLLTAKPVLYIANIDEDSLPEGNDHSARVVELAAERQAQAVVICAEIEAQIARIEDPAERADFLDALGLAEPGLDRVISAGYRLLDLITFFTAGPKETRAWTVRRGATAPEAAGVIHSDFQRGFIKAETVDFDNFAELGGEQACKEAGRMRQEGKGYVVQDGDIFHFRFNV